MVYSVYRFIKLGQRVFLAVVISMSRMSQKIFSLLVGNLQCGYKLG